MTDREARKVGAACVSVVAVWTVATLFGLRGLGVWVLMATVGALVLGTSA